MTVNLIHLADLQRVRIEISDRPDGTVLVERSPAAGFLVSSVVRGGFALPIVGGTGTLDDYDGWASDVLNHYRVVPVDPPTGLLLDGTAGGYASTPDNAALDITGDVVMAAEATLPDWDATKTRTLVAKYGTTANQRSYRLILLNNRLRVNWSTNGTNQLSAESTAAPVPAANGFLAVRAWLDVNDGSGNLDVTFYTAPSIDGPWTRLGDVATQVGTTSVFSGTAQLEIGSTDSGDSALWDGQIHRALVIAGNLGGTVVANPDFTAQANGATGFTDAAGRVWTVNGTAQIVGTEQDSITPSLEGEVWLQSIRYPAFNHPVVVQTWGGITRRSRSGLAEVSGRTNPTGLGEVRGPRQFELTVAVGPPFDLSLDAISEAGDEDLRLTVGDWFFIHVPPGRGVPGGYVMIGDTVEDRHPRAGDDAPRIFTLTCVAVNPPGADVVGGTITLGGLIKLAGSIEQAVATWPTIRDALETFGSLNDLVVL